VSRAQRPWGVTDEAAAPSTGQTLLMIALVAAAYIAGAKVGLHLAYANKNVTAVWPPTGISVAALLLLGVRVWPGVAAGALVSNLSNAAGFETSALIMVGNTLGPVVAWYLVRRIMRTAPRLERVSEVAVVVLIGGPVSMTVSATLGTLALAVTGALHGNTYWSTWLTWWVGDAVGVVIVSPLILMAAARCWRRVRFDFWRALEAIAALACIGGAAVLAFSQSRPLIFLVLPLAAWAAVRFFQLGAGAAVAIVAGVSITATVDGSGPFVHGLSTTGSLMTLQAFNGALALTTLMLAASSLQNARAQSALRTDAAQLEELLRQQRLAAFGDMTSVVSHDLRNPLATILNSHFLLRDILGAGLDGDAAICLDLAEREAQRALKLTEELLEYRRSARLVLGEVDLQGLVDEVIKTTPPPAGITLSVECEPVRMWVDQGQMARVLTNLVTNAYEAMGDAGTLQLAGLADGDAVTVSIRDTGPGFDQAVIDRVFDPFFTTKSTGTGLGLAIVRRLVESHGGHVTVSNRPTGGAAVDVLLPTRQRDLDFVP
jgi:signal transduction histidine kinase